jgi:hypothetical protein
MKHHCLHSPGGAVSDQLPYPWSRYAGDKLVNRPRHLFDAGVNWQATEHATLGVKRIDFALKPIFEQVVDIALSRAGKPLLCCSNAGNGYGSRVEDRIQ